MNTDYILQSIGTIHKPHLYKFIEDYTTQRDENSYTFSYVLGYNTKNKHEYLQKQINLKNIKMVKENEF